MKSTRHASAVGLSTLALCAAVPLLVGCWGGISLPVEMPVPLLGESVVTAAVEEGASPLANTAWRVYGDPQDPYLFFRMEFDARGDVLRIYDNQIFPEVLGAELIPDGALRAAPWPLGFYVAQCYVTNQGPNVGFVGLTRACLGPQLVGTGVLIFSGLLQGDRIDGHLDVTIELDPLFADVLAPLTEGFCGDVFAVPADEEPLPEADNEWASAQDIQLSLTWEGGLSRWNGAEWFVRTLAQPRWRTSGSTEISLALPESSGRFSSIADRTRGVGDRWTRSSSMPIPPAAWVVRPKSPQRDIGCGLNLLYSESPGFSRRAQQKRGFLRESRQDLALLFGRTELF